MCTLWREAQEQLSRAKSGADALDSVTSASRRYERRRGLAADSTRNHHDLLGCAVELVDARGFLIGINTKRGGAFGALLTENALGFTNRCFSLGIAYCQASRIPNNPVIATFG